MKLKKKPARPARKGVNPFTKEPCVFKAKPASKTVRALPMKKFKGPGTQATASAEAASGWVHESAKDTRVARACMENRGMYHDTAGSHLEAMGRLLSNVATTKSIDDGELRFDEPRDSADAMMTGSSKASDGANYARTQFVIVPSMRTEYIPYPVFVPVVRPVFVPVVRISAKQTRNTLRSHGDEGAHHSTKSKSEDEQEAAAAAGGVLLPDCMVALEASASEETPERGTTTYEDATTQFFTHGDSDNEELQKGEQAEQPPLSRRKRRRRGNKRAMRDGIKDDQAHLVDHREEKDRSTKSTEIVDVEESTQDVAVTNHGKLLAAIAELNAERAEVQLCIGDIVEAHSLANSRELNGRLGMIIGRQGPDRWQVDFDSPPGGKALRADNLRLVDEAELIADYESIPGMEDNLFSSAFTGVDIDEVFERWSFATQDARRKRIARELHPGESDEESASDEDFDGGLDVGNTALSTMD
jgi:hypothetical protein